MNPDDRLGLWLLMWFVIAWVAGFIIARRVTRDEPDASCIGVSFIGAVMFFSFPAVITAAVFGI